MPSAIDKSRSLKPAATSAAFQPPKRRDSIISEVITYNGRSASWRRLVSAHSRDISYGDVDAVTGNPVAAHNCHLLPPRPLVPTSICSAASANITSRAFAGVDGEVSSQATSSSRPRTASRADRTAAHGPGEGHRSGLRGAE
jgi:hypothetical protein